MADEDERPTDANVGPGLAHAEEATIRDTRLGPGMDIGGYIVDGEIGKGGMGYVYSATHPVIGKRAAIKVLKPDVSRSPIIVERFIQEARAVNRIGHPNIIDIFAFGELPDGRAYHVMDLLVGESLRKRLRRGPLHPSEAASVIDEIASALMAAHDKGFVHRDLKPDNVFLVEIAGRWPEVKLLDFGLAKLMPEAGIAPFQTKIGVMLGTPEYMSPEQARGVGVDYRTDIYALGVLTFEILAGVRPFPSTGDSIEMLRAHAEEPPPSIADLVPGLPLELVQLVAVMLAKEPAARPSLAAVRTVIKRLRTTQLPTRTAAGLEVSSFAGLAQRAAAAAAAAPVPSGPASLPTRPALSPAAHGADPQQRPRSTSAPPIAIPRAMSPQPAASTHGRGTGTVGTTTGSVAAVPQALPARAPSGPQPAPMPMPAPAPGPGAGLAGPAPQGLPGTVLGVGVPKSVRAGAAAAPTRPPVEAPRGGRVWLILGALIAIGAGIAIAIAVA